MLTTVLFKFVTPTGGPVANAPAEIQLAGAAYDTGLTGVLMPRLLELVTDEDGEISADLWPNDTLYYVTVTDPLSDAAISYKFLVPVMDVAGTPVRFQDIVVDSAMSGTHYDEAALAIIHDAKANSMAAQVGAQVSETNAKISETNAKISETSAKASETAALMAKDVLLKKVSVENYLFAGDPDDSLSIQRAIDALPSTGGQIDVPTKAYVVNTLPNSGAKSIFWNFSPGCTFTGSATGQNKFPSMRTNGGQMPVGPYIQSFSSVPYSFSSPVAGGVAAFNIEMIQLPNVIGQSVGLYVGAEGGGTDVNANSWSINSVLRVMPGAKGTHTGYEMDVDCMSSAALVKGLSINGIGTANPDVAIEVIRSDTTKWNTGIDVMNAVVGVQVRNTAGLQTGLAIGDPASQASAAMVAKQLANGGDGIVLQRATDTGPAGTTLRLVNAANNQNLYILDTAGNVLSQSQNVQKTVTVGNPTAQASVAVAVKQLTNGGDGLVLQRATDASPTGYVMRLIDAANSANLVLLDVAGNLYLNGKATYNFLQPGAGAVARTNQSKMADTVSVKDFGAAGDGTDATTAFSNAAKAAVATNTIPGIEGTALPRALQCSVIVPAGTYLITSEVDTGNREVTWLVSHGAKINGYNFLNGKVVRPGERQNGRQHGTNDFACGYSARSNGDLEDGAEVLGVTDPSQLATYTDRDSVGMYVDNTSPAATIDANTATYTSTTATIGAPSVTALRRLRRGMIIDTKHTPKWSGVIDSWNADGSVLTVTAWYRAGGNGAVSTPTNGTGLAVNGFTKMWAHNANVFLTAEGYAKGATGFELGVMNSRGASSINFADEENRVWGMDVVNLGQYKNQAAFIARGQFWNGFHAMGQDYGFKYQGRTGAPFTAVDDNNVAYFSVNSDGCVELGSVSDVLPRYIDFHTSGNNNDFDARIIATGGGAGNELGTLTYRAASHNFIGSASFNGPLLLKNIVTMDSVNASIEMGSQSAVNTPFIDFHSSGNLNDYDSRIIAAGGGLSPQQGTLNYMAGSHLFSGNVAILNNKTTTTIAGEVPGLKIGIAAGNELSWTNNPAAGDFVVLYPYISSSAVRTRVWAMNPIVDIVAGAPATAWCYEGNINVGTANTPDPRNPNHALGADMVSGGTYAPSAAYATSSTTLGNRWKHGIWFDNIGGQAGSSLIRTASNVSVDFGLDISTATINYQGVRVGATPAAQVAAVGVRQFANNQVGIFLQRATDTAPTGNLLQVSNAANNTVLMGVDASGNTSATGFRAKEVANGKQGVATLVAGQVIVANTGVTANSRIFLTSQNDGGTPGFLRVSSRVAGTSFTITSSSAADTSLVAYEIFEPA